MFFDGWSDLLSVVLKAPLAYGWVVVVLRSSGKRTLSKLNAFDLVVTVAFGSVLASALLDADVAWSEAAVAVSMLTAGQWLVAWCTARSRRFSRMVRAEPQAIVVHGVVQPTAMRNERLSSADLRAALRRGGVARIEDAALVVLETDGSISVLTSLPDGADATSDVTGIDGPEVPTRTVIDGVGRDGAG